MAEQLLLTGTIDESYLRVMDTRQTRVDIGITLLCHLGIGVCTLHELRDECIIALLKKLYSVHVYILHPYTVADMKDRCVMCGAGDNSISHLDYYDMIGYVYMLFHVLAECSTHFALFTCTLVTGEM